jgi:hypothetical protein
MAKERIQLCVFRDAADDSVYSIIITKHFMKH